MSNHLAIATATETLRQLLDAAAKKAVGGASATAARPDHPEQATLAPEIRLFLYGVLPNTAFRNADLPTRSGGAALVQRPVAALNLDYLISFYGNEAELEPQRLLGSAALALHASPILSTERIRAAVKTLTDGDANHFLRDSDLADQIETVRIIPLMLDLEETSKLWSVMFQIPYVLSVAYRVSLVLIESDETPVSPLPVREPRLHVRVLRRPVIDEVVAATDDADPIIAGATVVVRGHMLGGESVLLRVRDALIEPAAVAENEVRLLLAEPPFPAGALRAGLHPVQVVHMAPMGDLGQPRSTAESNAAALILRPVLDRIDFTSGAFTLTLSPPAGAAQRVVLLLNQRDGEAPASHVLRAPPRTAGSAEIVVPASDVRSGTYLARVQVDGAESPLEVDEDEGSETFGEYTGPTVTIP